MATTIALLGRTVLLSVANVDGEDYTNRNNGSPVAVGLVIGEDTTGNTVNLRVFLDGANTIRLSNVPVADIETVTTK